MKALPLRPYALFFPAAGVFAALQVSLWIHSLSGGPPFPAALDPLALHAHEMIFGFVAAVIAGFLLTAIPNWTGRLPVSGSSLVALFLLWLIGRLALLLGESFPMAAAFIDASFLLVMALMVWREILAGHNLRNLPVCLLISLLALCNIGWHAAYHGGWETAPYERGALAVIAFLIALIGGRVTPSFTRNWLAKQGEEKRLPAPFGNLDKAALIVIGLGLATWVFLQGYAFVGWPLLAAGAAVFLRLSRWRGNLTLAEPLLLVLHAAYGLLGLALLSLGAAQLWPHWISPQGALHALTAGAIGLVTLAVMSRAILGHSGRPLIADRMTQTIYLLAVAGAALRVSADWGGGAYLTLIGLGALSWGGAFLLFGLWYLRILTTPAKPKN